jgi:hypothetical protein
MGKIEFKVRLGKKLVRHHLSPIISTNLLGMVVPDYYLSYVEGVNRKIWPRPVMGKKQKVYLKNN